MSTLYTINGNYPNKYFAFTLNAENMSMADVNHSHSISDVSGLQDKLDDKADNTHTHECVEQLYLADKINSAHNVTMTIGSSSSENVPTITTSQNTIILSYVSRETNKVQQLINMNDYAENSIKSVMISTSPSPIIPNDRKTGILNFKENHYV